MVTLGMPRGVIDPERFAYREAERVGGPSPAARLWSVGHADWQATSKSRSGKRMFSPTHRGARAPARGTAGHSALPSENAAG